MRRLFFAVLLSILLGFASAEWVEKLRVQTVDNYMNPLSGCAVDVTYQKQLASGLDGKVSGKTNGDGLFEVILRNSVPAYTGDENRVYTVSVSSCFSFPGESRKVKYGDNPIGGAHLEQFQVNTTSAKVKITVTDQKGKPVPNATVSLGSISDLTDANGAVRFGVPLGDYVATLSKEGFTASQPFSLVSDIEVFGTLLIYENRLNVIATNEYGSLIPGVNLTFNGIELETNSSGEAEFTGLKVSTGTLKGIYNGMERTAEVEFFEENLTKTLVFAANPLIIDKIGISVLDKDELNCTLVVSCRARDERVALSKINVALTYSKNGGQWESITQKNELGVFEFSIPCSPPLEFSYLLKAWNDYGSAQTPVYNWTVSAPVVCQENETAECKTSEDCKGIQTCSIAGSWGICTDIPDDECPVIAPICGDGTCSGGETKETCPKDCKDGGGGFWFNLVLPEGMGLAMVVLILLGSLAVFGALGVLLLTQREKVLGIFEGLKNWLAAIRHVDKVIENADKEFERDKISQRYMKDGSTDDFFGLDKEDKGKPPGKPPAGPVKP